MLAGHMNATPMREATERMTPAGAFTTARPISRAPCGESPPSRDTADDRTPAWHAKAPGRREVHVGRNELLLRSGARFDGIYVVRSGMCKLVSASAHGDEHIAAFCLPEDVVGIEALGTGIHETAVRALQPTTFWHLPGPLVEALLQEDVDFSRALAHMLSVEAGRALRHALLLATMSADQRIAAFLLDLADRYRRRGRSDCTFELGMTRDEIGSHLGISTETVSRVLTRLRTERLVTVTGRRVALRDRAALDRVLLRRR